MSRKAPESDLELALLIERSLEEVTLEEDEIIATGAEVNKLLGRVLGQLAQSKEEARREKFKVAAVESRKASQRIEAELQRRRQPANQSKAFCGAGARPVQVQFHKLSSLPKEEAKQILEEAEALSSLPDEEE